MPSAHIRHPATRLAYAPLMDKHELYCEKGTPNEMASRSPAVAAELARLLYRQMPAVLAANLINSALVVFALWHSAGRAALLAWAGATAALALARAHLWLRFRRSGAANGDFQPSRWTGYFTVGSLAAELLFCVAVLRFATPGEPISLILFSFVIGGMAAGAVTTLSSHPPAFHAYILTSILPLAAELLRVDERAGFAMAGMVAAYVVALMLIGRNFHAVLVKAIEVNAQNRHLLTDMEREVQARQPGQIALSGRRQPRPAPAPAVAVHVCQRAAPSRRRCQGRRDTHPDRAQPGRVEGDAGQPARHVAAGCQCDPPEARRHRPAAAPRRHRRRLPAHRRGQGSGAALRQALRGPGDERPQSSSAHGAQPRRERHPLHRAGVGVVVGPCRRRQGPRRSRRQRHRHRSRPVEAHLRRVPTGRQSGARQDTRAGPGAGHRRAPVRHPRPSGDRKSTR